MYRVLWIRPERDGVSPGDQAVVLKILTDLGFTTSVAPLGNLDDGVEALCTGFGGRPPHLLILDLTAPASLAAGVLPLRHLHRIQRDAWGDAPPLLLIALVTQKHLNQRDWYPYVDDFLLPPHAPDELATRIRLLLFRRQHQEGSDRIRFHDVRLDLAGARALDERGQTVALTPREYELLRFLCTHPGKFFSRDRLLDLVWGVDYNGGARTVDIHILRLRAKLPPLAATAIENRRGVGYGITALDGKP